MSQKISQVEIDSVRRASALHEAAHAVAAIQLRAQLWQVQIVTVTGRDRSSAIYGTSSGRCHAGHDDLMSDSLITLAGWAWEERYGDPRYGEGDYSSAQKALTSKSAIDHQGADFEEAKNAAGILVERHKPIIELAADMFLAGANSRGDVGKRCLSAVKKIVRERLGRI